MVHYGLTSFGWSIINLNVLSSTSTKTNWKLSIVNLAPTYNLRIILNSLGVSLGVFRFEKNLQPNAPRKVLRKLKL